MVVVSTTVTAMLGHLVDKERRYLQPTTSNEEGEAMKEKHRHYYLGSNSVTSTSQHVLRLCYLDKLLLFLLCHLEKAKVVILERKEGRAFVIKVTALQEFLRHSVWRGPAVLGAVAMFLCIASVFCFIIAAPLSMLLVTVTLLAVLGMGAYWLVLDASRVAISCVQTKLQTIVLDDLLQDLLAPKPLAMECLFACLLHPILTLEHRIQLAQSVLGLTQEQAHALLCQPGGVVLLWKHVFSPTATHAITAASSAQKQQQQQQQMVPLLNVQAPPEAVSSRKALVYVAGAAENAASASARAVVTPSDEPAPPVPEITTTTSITHTATKVKKNMLTGSGDEDDDSSTVTSSVEEQGAAASCFHHHHHHHHIDAVPNGTLATHSTAATMEEEHHRHHPIFVTDDGDKQKEKPAPAQQQQQRAVVAREQQQQHEQQQLADVPPPPLTILWSIFSSWLSEQGILLSNQVSQQYVAPNLPPHHQAERVLERCLSVSASVLLLQLLCSRRARQLLSGALQAALLLSAGTASAVCLSLLVALTEYETVYASFLSNSSSRTTTTCTSTASEKQQEHTMMPTEKLDHCAHEFARRLVYAIQQHYPSQQPLQKYSTQFLRLGQFLVQGAQDHHHGRGDYDFYWCWTKASQMLHRHVGQPVARAVGRKKRSLSALLLVLVLAHWKQQRRQRQRRGSPLLLRR